jgi:hypothetical protein
MSSSGAGDAGAEGLGTGTRVGHVQSAGRKAKALMVEDNMNTRFALSVLLRASRKLPSASSRE